MNNQLNLLCHTCKVSISNKLEGLLEFDICEDCMNEELRNTDFTQNFEAQKPEELVKCDDCGDFIEAEEINQREWQHGILDLCEGCASEHDDNCRGFRDEINEIEDDIIFNSGRDFTSHLEEFQEREF